MGGAAAGEVASSMAVESIAEHHAWPIALAEAPAGVIDDDRTALARSCAIAARDANSQHLPRSALELSRGAAWARR